MKTFKDLEFQPHLAGKGIHAIISFDNGYGLSVVQGENFYSDPYTYEVAVLKDGCIVYDFSETGDVFGWQSPEKIEELMQKVQAMP